MFFLGATAYDDPETAIRSVIKEVIFDDDYGLREYFRRLRDPQAIKTIVDVGANVGVFSVFARILFPMARIIALEPCNDTFELLKRNTCFFKIECYRVALGKPGILHLDQKKNNSTINAFVESATGAETVPALSLADIFREAQVVGPYALKVDCECGELALPGNANDGAILSNAAYLGIEAHVGLFGEQREPWLSWFKGLFGERHELHSLSLWDGGAFNFRVMERALLS